MDYKEKYKTALEMAKGIINYYKSRNRNEAAIEDLQEIFPELKESEDEKIRETLIKFHKGDWLCENEPNNYARFIQILEIVNVQGKERYRISRDIHNDEDIIEFDFVEKYYHKFDIKDAKDGDMLYLQHDGKEHIIIYKGVIKERFRTFVSAYCAYNGIVDAFCFADVSRYADIAYGGIMPATKEQRDLLFQKMKEEGCEWDAEKKKLKKIEQKQKWSEEDEYILDETIKHLEELIRIDKTKHCACDVQYYQRDIDWLKSLKNRIVSQTKEWSKENERNFQNIDSVLFREISLREDECMRLRDWLQSLKQRTTWKPTVNEKSKIELAEPTPITPKILQKNGFELKPNGWLWCQDKGNEGQNYIFIQFRKDLDEVRLVEISFVGKIQATFRQVQDVHELQNLLNVCRIKKEIEL